MIQIDSILDSRGQSIAVGDTVVYAGTPEYHRSHEDEEGQLVVIVRKGPLQYSKVKSIVSDDCGGFAECGRKIYVELEDGHKTWGDSENGGYNLLRLA